MSLTTHRRWQHSARIGAICIAIFFGSTHLARAQAISWRGGPEELPAQTLVETSKTLAALAPQRGQIVKRVVVQFVAEPSVAERELLRRGGLALLRPLGSAAYFASLSGSPDQDLLRDVSIRAVSEIALRWKMHERLWDSTPPAWARAAAAPDGDATVGVYVLLHADVRLEDGIALAEAYGIDVRDVLESVNGLVVELPYDVIPAFAAEDIVQWIEPPLPRFSEVNNSNRSRTQADTLQGSPYNLDGIGVTVLVYDGGYARQSHDDFGGRLTVRDSSGLSGHATHVAGTIGGSGAASGGTYRGMAPGVIMQSYGFEYDGSGIFLYSNPGDIESDYSAAINTYGADISNNSIGTNTASNGFPCDITGDYGVTSALIDNIVRGSVSGGDPFRIVWANGNERGSSRCGNTYVSTAPPAGAKNHITVGALNSNDDSMTYFSSWGPVDDGRLKPDISGPGCQSNDDDGVTSCYSGSDTQYASLCGTSMAAPTVTGCCALLLEDYRDQFPSLDDPRNSTLKILLAQEAVDRGNTGPDYQFGYGSVRIRDTVDFMRLGYFLEESVTHGGAILYSVQVNAGDPELKITLAWDDPAGTPNVVPSLVNDVDLRVYDPSGGRRYPWTLDPGNPANPAVQNAEDHLNNIEQVYVSNPTSGTWTVEVRGYNIPQGPQVYSLCASHDIQTGGMIDCNNNGVPDADDIAGGTSEDCNNNSVPDECDIADGFSDDCNHDGIPDECQAGGTEDCNGNGSSDWCDIDSGASEDCNGNNIPDECEIGPTPITISFDLSSNPGWSTQGLWAYGQPSGGGGQYGEPDPTSGYTGNNVYGYNLAGDYENDLAETHLTTTAIDCTGVYNMTVSFRRWLNVERNRYDHAYFRVSNDGSNWTTLWANPDSHVTDNSWVLEQYDISSVADNQATVYLRWTMGETDGSWQFSGWNIDDIVLDGEQLAGGDGDCNANGVPDECDIAGVTSDDCNNNSVPDECDIAEGTSSDSNGNGIPDECEGTDCNNNGIPDGTDINDGRSMDCNNNGVPDECDIAGVTSEDCNGDVIPDECQLSGQTGLSGAYYDEMEFGGNVRGRIDAQIDFDWGTGEPWTDLGSETFSIRWTGYVLTTSDSGTYTFYTRTDDGVRLWVDGQLIVDKWIDQGPTEWSGTISLDASRAYPIKVEYYENGGGAVAELRWEPPGGAKVIIPSGNLLPARDCNGNATPDSCDIDGGIANDCNANGLPDSCDIADGISDDCNNDSIPDECQLSGNDCNNNGVLDECDIAGPTSEDCNADGIPDECQLAGNDCNNNGVPDDCEIAGNDCNNNGVLDECDVAGPTSEDCNADGIPDECQLAGNDCNNNGVPDDCEIAGNDCNNNGVLDECDVAGPTSEDCNADGIPDECQLAGNDCNNNGVPDECDIAGGTSNDTNGNGIPDECESLAEACCLPDGSCDELTPTDCSAAGGTPQGVGTVCDGMVCPYLEVTVDLANVHAAQVQRCVVFELSNCVTSTTETVNAELDFVTPEPYTDNARATAMIALPPGVYDCLIVRDPHHTLAAHDPSFGVSGHHYVTDLTGSLALMSGNLNDDGWIDIIDYGVFVNLYGTAYGDPPSGDCSCHTPLPHADLDGDGGVTLNDFSFIQIGFLSGGADPCCTPLALSPPRDGPRRSISVVELHQYELGDLARADLNGDGWLDEDDMAAFLRGKRPGSRPDGVRPGVGSRR